MKKILNIPYYSQYRDIKDEYWKSRACGAICLKMVLDYLQPENKKLWELPVTVEEFMKLANEKGAYGKNGWIHQGLISVARDFGVKLERKEFKSKVKKDSNLENVSCKSSIKNENADYIKLDEEIKEVIFSLKKNNPVIVSVVKRFKEEKKFHMVVLTGFEIDESGEVKGFYYNDTDYNKEQEGKNLFVDVETFKKFWRKLAIFVS